MCNDGEEQRGTYTTVVEITELIDAGTVVVDREGDDWGAEVGGGAGVGVGDGLG